MTHDLYLKAVNHPIRREILTIINGKKKISRNNLIEVLKDKKIIDDESMFNYNIDFLIKALCVEITEDEKECATMYQITQKGKVVDYL